MTEEEIVRRLLERDESGLAALDAAYRDPAMSVAYRILQNREDAEECVQDGLQRIWESIPPKQPDRLRYYFITLVRNRALEVYRASHAQKRGGGAATVALEELAECVAGSEDVEREAEASQLVDALNRFLGTLPEKERNLFLRRYYYLEEPEALAARFHLSRRHVAVMLFRTRKKLQAFLKKEDYL